MLTKQEREATIERIKSYGDSDLPFYKLLFGSRAPYAMQYTEYLKALKDRVIDLCDTSNMLELPVDKDGEPVLIGNIVYDNDNVGYEVTGYTTRDDFPGVLLATNGNSVLIPTRENELTHREPVTISSLAQQIRNILADDEGDIREGTYNQLSCIAEQLERLGDSDE